MWWRRLSQNFSLASLACRAEPLHNEQGTMSERPDLLQQVILIRHFSPCAQAFKGFDIAIAEAAKQNIRLVIALTNNWNYNPLQTDWK